MPKKQYKYSGRVEYFDRIIKSNYTASTWAETPGKAKSNLAYRYSKMIGYGPSHKIRLIDSIEEVSK